VHLAAAEGWHVTGVDIVGSAIEVGCWSPGVGVVNTSPHETKPNPSKMRHVRNAIILMEAGGGDEERRGGVGNETSPPGLRGRTRQHSTRTQQHKPMSYLATRKGAPTPGSERRARKVTCGQGQRRSPKGQVTVKGPRRVGKKEK
jgi:hypothetical protein